MGFEEALAKEYVYLVFWFKRFCLSFRDINKNATRRNNIEIYSYYKVTLYVSGIKAHIIRSHDTVTAASVTYHFTGKTTSPRSHDQTTLEGSSCTDNMTEP